VIFQVKRRGNRLQKNTGKAAEEQLNEGKKTGVKQYK
jgi:hypothetical protein